MVGSLGEVVFEVSSESIRTFRDLSMQRSAKYVTHEVHGGKALLEFTGFAPISAALTVRLDAALGLNPTEELEALRGVLSRHEAVPFILDGTPQGDHLWVLESLDEKHEVLNSTGALIVAEVSLTLKEYVESGADGT